MTRLSIDATSRFPMDTRVLLDGHEISDLYRGTRSRRPGDTV